MIGLDTNIIVRYLAQDDARQSAAATRFIEKTLSTEEPGYISLIVLVEVVWVLTVSYALDRARITAVLEALLTTQQFKVESAELVWRATNRYGASRADFSDLLIAECAVAAGCTRIVTFDRSAAASGALELLG